MLRMLRSLRLVKVQKVLGSMCKRFNSSYVGFLFKIMQLILYVLGTAHVGACIWRKVGDVPDGWVHTESIDERPLGDQYLYSFQWSLARLHPNNMSDNMKLKTLTERILSVVTTILATVGCSVFISV